MRYLPPLLVALAFAAIVARCAQEPHRDEARMRISGLVQGARLDRARELLEDYASRYDQVDDRWFEAGMWFRLRDPVRAFDTIWEDPRIASAQDTAQRFAEHGLFALGWETSDRIAPTVMEPWVLLALTEGGNAWARQRLNLHARELDLRTAIRYFFPAYRNPSRVPLDALVEAFRQREGEPFQVAAALGGLRAESYPEKDQDIALLGTVLASEQWRREFADVWLVATLALGRSGEESAIQILQETAASLTGSNDPRDQGDLTRVRIGLVAAGRFEVDDAVAAVALGAEPDLQVTSWYLEAMLHRYRSGDMRSEVRLRQIWEGPGARIQGLRSRIARSHLMTDTPPSEEALKVFVGRIVRELEAPNAPLISRVIAQAWRLRSGEAGARDGLLELLRTIAQAFTSGERKVIELAEPFVEGLRALYLYG
jgi:hypothetical protein